MIAALPWYEASANALGFLALLLLAYVLPRSLKEGLGARLPLLVSSTTFLLIGAVSRINLAAEKPVSWWSDVTTYVQPLVVLVFLACLTLDSMRAVRRWASALEMIYTEMGETTGDRVTAIIRAVRR